MRQSRTRPVEKLTPERLATNSTNSANFFRGIREIRGRAFSEFVAIRAGPPRCQGKSTGNLIHREDDLIVFGAAGRM